MISDQLHHLSCSPLVIGCFPCVIWFRHRQQKRIAVLPPCLQDKHKTIYQVNKQKRDLAKTNKQTNKKVMMAKVKFEWNLSGVIKEIVDDRNVNSATV